MNSPIHRLFSGCTLAALTLTLGTHLSAQDVDKSKGPFGGTGGTAYKSVAASGFHISRVTVAYGASEINGIGVNYTNMERNLALKHPIGTFVGTQEHFSVPVGELLESAVIWYTTTRTTTQAVTQITLRTTGGTEQTFGKAGASDVSKTLAQSDYEIAGFHGNAGSQIDSLGVYLRPAWTSTKGTFFGSAKNVGNMRLVPVGHHISAIEVQQTTANPKFISRIRIKKSDPHGNASWISWLGGDSSGESKVFEIDTDDYIQSIQIRHWGLFIYQIIIKTANGEKFGMGSSAANSVIFTADANHELAGFYGKTSRVSIQSFGILQRPRSSRVVEFDAGCAGSSGLPPTLTINPPKIAGELLCTVGGAPVGTFGLIVLSPRQTKIPLFGCTLRVQPDLMVPVALPQQNQLRIAMSHSWRQFIGRPFYVQAFLLDPANQSALGSLTPAHTVLVGDI